MTTKRKTSTSITIDSEVHKAAKVYAIRNRYRSFSALVEDLLRVKLEMPIFFIDPELDQIEGVD